MIVILYQEQRNVQPKWSKKCPIVSTYTSSQMVTVTPLSIIQIFFDFIF